MQLVLEQTTKKYIKEENNSITIQTDMKQYHYESETEKMNHKKEMEKNGWEDSGQVKEMISGSLMPWTKDKPKYVWFGSYSKWQRIEN